MKYVCKNGMTYLPKSYSNEEQFEAIVQAELDRTLPEFFVIPFKKDIESPSGRRNCPDLAIIAKDLSCWFLIEVELSHHSLKNHVLPQVETFIEGEYTREHAAYIRTKIPELCEHALFRLLRYKRPVVLVVADSEAAIDKKWQKHLHEIGCNLGIMEVLFSERDDSLILFSGYLPEKPRVEEVKLKKHAQFNALMCAQPPQSLSDMHSAILTVNFNGTLHKLQIVSGQKEAILFLNPQPEIEKRTCYYMDYSSTSNLRIMTRRALKDGR